MADGELVRQERVFTRSRGRGWGVKCTSPKRDGNVCPNWAIVGGYVCMKHGGQLPVVRASATARIRSLAPAAVLVIERALTEGKPDTQLRAARFVLKYSGITPQNVRSVARNQKALEQGAPVPSTDAEIDAMLIALMEAPDEGRTGEEAPA